MRTNRQHVPGPHESSLKRVGWWLLMPLVCGLVLAAVLFSPDAARKGASASGVAAGGWAMLPRIGAINGQGLSDLSGAKLGHKVVVVAGSSYDESRVEGLILDIPSHSWRRMRRSPLGWRTSYSAVATRHEVIVWGGTSDRGDLANGAAHNPFGNTWRRLAQAPLSARRGHTAVWTGREMVIWGGQGGSRRRIRSDGAAYLPSANTWRRIAPAPLSRRQAHTAVWTGDKMIVWGGTADRRSDTEIGRAPSFGTDGAAYDPVANRWSGIRRSPIRSSANAEAVWTGESMLVWTGTAAAVYSPRTNTWRRARRPPLKARDYSTAVWSGTELLVWGGTKRRCGDCFLRDGAAYSVTHDSWRRLPKSPLSARDRHVAVWSGNGMIIWGGCCSRERPELDGAVYRPPA